MSISTTGRWRGALLLTACCGLLLRCGDGPAIHGSARVRILHASHDAPPVSVSIDQGALLPALAFGLASSYLPLAPGLWDLDFKDAAGDGKMLLRSGINAGTRDYTVYLVNAAAQLETTVSSDDRAIAPGIAAVRLVHASPDAPALDLRFDAFDGDPLFEQVAFKAATTYQALNPGAYSLVLLRTPAQGALPAAGDVLAAYEPWTVERGKAYTIVALGTLSGADPHVFMLRVFTDTGVGNSSTDLLVRAP